MKKQVIKIVILFISILSVGNTYAQVDSAKAAALRKQLVDSVCSCVSKEDAGKIKTVEGAQQLITQCFMGDAMSVFGDYLIASGADMTDMNAMQGLGIKITTELAGKCPSVIQMMMNIAQDPNEMKKLQEQMEQVKKMFPNEVPVDSTKKYDLL